MLHDQIKKDIQTYLKARDEEKLKAVRNILAAFTNELVAKKRKPQETLADDEATSVIMRLTKQRKESIEQFKAGGRNDLVESEEKELACLQTYLPEMAPKDEILKIARSKKDELNITDKSKLGILMGAVMKEFKGRADGSAVKEVVEKLFL